MQKHSGAPEFTLRRRFFSRACTVTARWPNGKRVVISGFADPAVAQYWIEVEAANWLERRGLSLQAA